jgi:steroid delta-isomerase-like uncharacterized protein
LTPARRRNRAEKMSSTVKRLLALVLPGIFGAMAATVLAPAPAAASGATAADIERWSEAWNSHDIDKVTALFSADTVVDQPSNPKPLDAASLRKFFTMIFHAYPDFHITVEDKVIDGWKAVTIERVTGHWLGTYTDPATGKTTQPNGNAFDHPGAMYIVYDTDHKIKLLRIFWDQLTVDKQLGVAPR